MPTPQHLHLAWESDVLSLYQRLLPAEFLHQAQKQAGLRQNNRVYSLLVVMWLIIAQRLHGQASLESAVLELLRGLPAGFWPQPCKRLQSQTWLSSRTGAYNKARLALPLPVVEQSCDRIFERLTALTSETLPAIGRRAFFFDGTSVRLAHSQALCQLYPPGCSQNGEAHWPLLRMLVAHDLQTGLALRPQWGAMYGAHAVSEQQLLEAAIDRLPVGSVAVGDANFGVFSVAYAATVQRSYGVILRLTVQRAQRLAGEPLQDGIDRAVVWKPSREDRKTHPGMPPDAEVRGRLIVRRVQPSNAAAPFLLALFTGLDLDQDEIFKVYGQRWNIETDLRSLKATLQLEHLRCTTPEMVAKELDLAMAAYNLVRTVACLASQKTGVPPRGYSFTRVRNVIQTFTPLITAAKNESEAKRQFDRMMYYVEQAKLPQRKRKRPSYPRAVWLKRESFPRHKQ